MSEALRYKPGRIRDENQQSILAAAEQEFVRQGYRGATMQGIADRAGLPKANVHYYFKNKANLYRSVLDRIVTLWNAAFSEISADDDPAIALDRFVREKVRLSFAQPRASKLFAMEIISGAPHLGDYLRDELRGWVDARVAVIDTWIAQGRLTPCEPRRLIYLIWSATQHYADFETQVLALDDKIEYSAQDVNDVAEFLSRTILTGCGLTPPADRAHG
ncbi:MAG: TetR/AcrR family transcriptional regulator [Pseudomonadota bacterium]